MWGVLWFVWRFLVEIVKYAVYVVFCGDIYIPFLVISIQFHSALYFSFPIYVYFEMVSDFIYEMEVFVFGK